MFIPFKSPFLFCIFELTGLPKHFGFHLLFKTPVLPDIAFLNVIHVFFFVCENLRFSSVFLTNHVFPTFFRPFLRDHTCFDHFHRYLLPNNTKKKSLAPSALANLNISLQFFTRAFSASIWLTNYYSYGYGYWSASLDWASINLGSGKKSGEAGNTKPIGDW